MFGQINRIKTYHRPMPDLFFMKKDRFAFQLIQFYGRVEAFLPGTHKALTL